MDLAEYLRFFLALGFVLVWSLLLGTWVAFGWDLGPGGPLRY